MAFSVDFWTDLRLILTLVLFVYIVQWAISQTGNKKMGVIIGSIVSYLTIFKHWELVLFIVLVFFGYNFFYRLEEATRLPGVTTDDREYVKDMKYRPGSIGPYVEDGALGLSGKGWMGHYKKK